MNPTPNETSLSRFDALEVALELLPAGSAQEVKDALRTCLAAGFIDDGDLTEVWPLVDRECAMTWRMTH